MDLPGQVSYRPVDGAEAGDLCSTRITEPRPRCLQLIPFEQWSAPTRTSVPLPPATTFQRTKSQRNWLYKTHPEAFLGNLDLPTLISEETRAQQGATTDAHAGSVLAIGEIVDLRNAQRVAKCPVVALAAGEAGHILQLSLINPENWSWNDSAFAMGAPQTKFQGSWCSDGCPISKLAFATKLKDHDTLRWLIAQKETSTTIFEPELRANPMTASISTSDATADHIFLKPMVTLTTDLTGGESHCDFSINLGSNDVAPQLAVVDRSGNWSVWYIGREGYGRGRTAKAVLLSRGGSKLPASAPSGPSCSLETYKISWTTRSNRSDEWERDSSPSAQSDVAGDPQVSYSVGLDLSRPKYDGLVVCSHTQLQVLDVDGARPPSSLEFSRRDGSYALLDAQSIPGSSSYVVVLTADMLYLLDATLSEVQAKSPAIIASCRHFRQYPRESMKMSVTKLSSSAEEANSLVSIYSAQNFRVDFFWLIVSHQDRTARFGSQVVHFPGLNTENFADLQGIESLAAVQMHLAASQGKHRQEVDAEGVKKFADVQLHQLYVLTTNLSLHTTIVAITHEAQQDLPEPVKRGSLMWTDARRARFLRRKWLQDIDEAFVIPDMVEQVEPASVTYVPGRVTMNDTLQLRHYLVRLVQEVNRGLLGDDGGGSPSLNGSECLNPVRQALKDREEGENIALKPLLGSSDLWKPVDISALEDEVESSLRVLERSQELQFFHCGNYGPTHSAMDLFEKASINWSSSLQAEALKPTQWRYMELALEKMAAEVYLSQKGVYIAPQSTLDLAAKSSPQEEIQRAEEDDLASHSQSSQAMRTPSSSRATSEALRSSQGSQEETQEPGQEDPAVARLRMYLPSIKFTAPPKKGPSRIISLWPEHRGVDPSDYYYEPPGAAESSEKLEAAKRRLAKYEERRRRKAERNAQLGIKMEGIGEPFSQPYRPTMSRSSPLRALSQEVGSSQAQAHSQGVADPSSQPQADSQGSDTAELGSQSQSQGRSQPVSFARGRLYSQATSQTMSQPLPGEFGGRRPKFKKKASKGFK